MAFPSRIGCSGGDVRILAGGRRACSKCANYKHGNRPRAAGCGHALRSAVCGHPGRSDGSSASAHLNSTDNNSGRSDTAGCYHHHRTSKGAEKEEVWEHDPAAGDR